MMEHLTPMIKYLSYAKKDWVGGMVTLSVYGSGSIYTEQIF